jgi:DNA primase
MKEAGNDVSRKSEVVNQVAETLSKINKAEDFIKQQGYVKQCAEILKIDEGGLTNLVNKYKRDRISKDEKRLPFEEANFLLQDNKKKENYIDDNVALINEDEQHERNVLRVLLEYGLNKWDEEKSIADFIFEELEAFNFDNKELEVILNTYKDAYHNNQKPTTKSFLYSNDKNMADLVVAVTMFPFELSFRKLNNFLLSNC